MMVAWAPDLVTPEERADLDASMADAQDIHDAIIRIIHITVSYVLEEADTGDLGLWGFIYVLLVFMRSLKTRPDLLEWFGWAFHAELLAPFLNMLLREDEIRGGGAWESASQPEFPTSCSPLNQIEKPGSYWMTIRDLVREKYQKAEGARSTATAEEAAVTTKETQITAEEATVTTNETSVTTEETQTTAEEATATTEETTTTAEEATASDVAHDWHRDTETPGAERVFTEPLPEHEMLRGNIFAREPESSWYKYPAKLPEDVVVQPSLPAPKVTPAVLQAAKKVVAEQAQAESPADLETEREAPEGEQKEGENEDARREEERKGGNVEETRQEDEQKESEDEGERQAEVERQEALLRDPPLFPANWFKNSKYDYEERQVRRNSVQDAKTCEDRYNQILWLTFQLMGPFFSLQTDEDGRHWISVPRAQWVPQLDLDKKMPEVVERIGGVRIVYVNRSIRIAEIEMIRAWEERERQKEKAEGDTKELISEDGPSRSYETEHTEVEVDTALPAQGADDSQDTAGRDAGAATTTAPTDDQAADTQLPAHVVRLTKEALDKIPLSDEAAKAAGRVIPPTTEGGWTCISEESHDGATAPVAAASVISRLFGLGR